MLAKQFIILFLKGSLLGLAILLPGLSGGTLAFLLNIYQKLLQELTKIKIDDFKTWFFYTILKKSHIKKNNIYFWNTLDWKFFLPLVFGALFSGMLFVFLISPLLEDYFLQFYSIIFGLVLASTLQLFKNMNKTKKTISLFILSFAIQACFYKFPSFHISLNDLESIYLFIPIGFLISCTLIIPGLSGSYMLLILGLYDKMLLALRQGELPILICFSIGLILGCFVIAKWMQKMITKHFDTSLACILGFILASLFGLYPLATSSLNQVVFLNNPNILFFSYSTGSVILYLILMSLYKKEYI